MEDQTDVATPVADPFVQDHVETAPAEPIKNDKEINFERLRKEKERLEKESREKDAKIKELESIKNAIDIGDDDLVDGKQFKTVAEKQAYLEKRQLELETKIRVEEALRKYQDINEVVTEENLNKLQQIEPEIHANLQNKDPYISWVNAYKHIKKYVLEPSSRIEEKRLQENKQQSPSLQKAGRSSGGIKEDILQGPLTPELRALLLENRKKARSRYQIKG